MPVHPDTPEPLKSALEDMEAQVQDFKSSLAFAAPEQWDLHYGQLQMGLAETLTTLYKETGQVGYIQSD